LVCEKGYCTAFGGVYFQANAACSGGAMCLGGNHYASMTCACPPGDAQPHLISYIGETCNAVVRAYTLTACQPTTLPPNADWGGSYALLDSGACGMPNPYTNACACPAPLVAQTVRIAQDDGTVRTVAFCGPPGSAPTGNYGGIFMTDMGG